MAESDWTVANDSLNIASLDRGVTAGLPVPNGGGSFVYGFNSLDTSIGAAALFTNQANFAPMAKGGSVRGVVKRATSGGTTGFSCFLFIGLQGPSVNDYCYMLGLSDADPSHLVLKKGVLSSGLTDFVPDPANNGILRRSTGSIAIDEFAHIRLDMIVNLNGDVRLQVFKNDLAAHALGTAPTWAAVPGMTEFVDDALAVNSGSAPFTSGRIGFGFRTSDVTRRGVVDHVECLRQL